MLSKKEKKRRVKERHRKKVANRYIKSEKFIQSRKESELSEGERSIAEFLKNNNVPFVREFYTAYCYNRKTNNLLFFDFYLPEQRAVIEFDGQHHYKPIYGAEKLKQQKYKDRVKNKYCKKKGIEILRIPYWMGSKIEEVICRWFDLTF